MKFAESSKIHKRYMTIKGENCSGRELDPSGSWENSSPTEEEQHAWGTRAGKGRRQMSSSAVGQFLAAQAATEQSLHWIPLQRRQPTAVRHPAHQRMLHIWRLAKSCLGRGTAGQQPRGRHSLRAGDRTSAFPGGDQRWMQSVLSADPSLPGGWHKELNPFSLSSGDGEET